jgi:hypothetical protein
MGFGDLPNVPQTHQTQYPSMLSVSNPDAISMTGPFIR